MNPVSQPVQFDDPVADLASREESIAPAPRVSVQAFCETVETAAAIQAAGEDRRLAKAHLRIQMGGLIAAIEAYQNSPTPNVIILESESRGNDILKGLDLLAPVCDATTRVIIIGKMNDVTLYRELVRRGVSDYMIAPVSALQIVRAVCGSVFSAGRQAGGSHHSGGRREGRGRGLHSRAQYRVLDRTRLDARFGRYRSRSGVSVPPAWILTKTRRKVLLKRYFLPTASTTPSSTGCCRNAPIT